MRSKFFVKYLPVGLKVRGEKVLVVGAGEVALHKIRVILPCGPEITVVAPRVCPGVERLAASGKVQLFRRKFRDADARGAVLVISAADVRRVNEQVRRAGHRFGAVVNVVDVPDLCDLIFVSIFRYRGFIFSISTDGKNPAKAKALRLFLEERIHEFCAANGGRVRPRLKRTVKE